MSDGLHNVAGAVGEVDLNGRKFRTSKLRLRHKAEIEAHILANRPDLVDEVARSVERLPETLQAKYGHEFIGAAVAKMQERKSVGRDEYSAYLDTFDGVCYTLWQMLREQHPELEDYAQVKALCVDIPIEILQFKVEMACGEHELKNFAGRTEGPAETTASAPLGPDSTASSPPSSAGPPSKSEN